MMKIISTLFKSNYALSLRAISTEATFQTKEFKLHLLDSGPSSNVHLTRNDALEYYRLMQTIRRMETSAGNLYKEQKVRGFCHLYSGQEACAVGMKASMDSDDTVITSYRCHAWTYLMGSTVTQILTELTGRVTGSSHGKGGSMHMYGKNFFGGNGIVGAQQALGTGLAFAMKYLKQKNVSLTLYGDGAANQGQFYESANMAKLWDLPVLFICENNGFGMGTPAKRASACTDYYTRGHFVPGIWVDGMDVLAVRETIRWAKEYCNAGKGPLVLELETYRYSGHSMSDPGTSYRTREEVQEVRKSRDPIAGFKDRLITSELATEDELKQIDSEAKKEVENAVDAAHKEGPPPLEMLLTDLYHNTPPQFVRGVTVDDTTVQPFTTTKELLISQGKI